MMHHSLYFILIDVDAIQCKTIFVDQHNTTLGEGISGAINPIVDDKEVENIIEQITLLSLKQENTLQLTLNIIINALRIKVLHYHPHVINFSHPFLYSYLTTYLHIVCINAHNNHDQIANIIVTDSYSFFVYQQQKIELRDITFSTQIKSVVLGKD
ncbi:hypothetical protein [uncultured Shewanella sp.]|uniref:hypothetical protein n=1 Tax=uncultured Shewanella sp. TaxID=173975 RepID=UPI0026300694|nr:hypothetical protein [uncultured Shewanella sp.]